MRRSAAPVLATLALAVVCFAALELVSRAVLPVYLPSHPRGFYEADREAAYRPAPHRRGRIFYGGRALHVRTNSQGLRDRDYGPRRADVARVLMIGDSQTFGLVPEKDTLPRQLERALRARGIPAEVLNGGVLGYGTDQELARLKQLLPLYRPDVVVLTVYPNDPWDNGIGAHRHWRVGEDGWLHNLVEPPPPPRRGLGGLRDWAVTHVNVAGLLSYAKTRLVKAARGEETPPPAYVTRLLARRWDAAAAHDWRLTDSLIGEAVEAARQSGATPLLVDGASREAVSWSMWPRDTNRALYDLDRETALLDSTAARARVHCLHVLPALRQAPRSAGLFLPGDEHWSRRGNALVAEHLLPDVSRALGDRPSGARMGTAHRIPRAAPPARGRRS